MSDPVTIGALTASAIGVVAEQELVKATVGEAVKEAYKALRDKVASWASREVAILEQAPSSSRKQLAVAEIADTQSEDDRRALKALIENLLAKVKQQSAAIGLDVHRVTNLEMDLGKVTVTGGVGVRVHGASGGKLKIDDISVGERRGK